MTNCIATLIILLTLGFSACSSQQKTADSKMEYKEMELAYLEGYFPKNDIVFKSEQLLRVIHNAEDFESFFGKAKTMDNTITKIDFDAHSVVAIILKPSYTTKDISIQSIFGNNDTIIVYFEINSMEKQTYSSTTMKIFKIPKSVKLVNLKSEKESLKLNVTD